MSTTALLLIGLLEGGTDATLDTGAVWVDAQTVYLKTLNHDVGVILTNTHSDPWPQEGRLVRVVTVPFAALPGSAGSAPDAPELEGSIMSFCWSYSAGLDWNDPDDHGSAITLFTVYWGEGDLAAGDLTLLGTTATSEYTESNLDPFIVTGVGYSFAVTATNGNGTSAFSNVVHLTGV